MEGKVHVEVERLGTEAELAGQRTKAEQKTRVKPTELGSRAEPEARTGPTEQGPTRAEQTEQEPTRADQMEREPTRVEQKISLRQSRRSRRPPDWSRRPPRGS